MKLQGNQWIVRKISYAVTSIIGIAIVALGLVDADVVEQHSGEVAAAIGVLLTIIPGLAATKTGAHSDTGARLSGHELEALLAQASQSYESIKGEAPVVTQATVSDLVHRTDSDEVDVDLEVSDASTNYAYD